MKVLLVENVHTTAVENFKSVGFSVDLKKDAPSEDDLIKMLPNYQVLGIRSKTQLTAKVIKACSHLHAIGAFCIGTNQIDLNTSNRQGLPVFNAPYSNTRSVAELVIAEIISLSRQLGDVNMAAHQKIWLKSAKGSFEVRGKTLGIIGYGHIGTQVSILAEALGLRVVYYDIIKKLPLGNAKAVDSLEQLLGESDFVTLHVPETTLTQDMVGPSQLKAMKRGSYLINASRGSVVDIPALASALKEGQLGGAALDVFPLEPSGNSEPFLTVLQGLKNVILTPHIGGSTEEAQEEIGREVSHSLIQFLTEGSSHGAVNFPNLDVPPRSDACRLINVHRNVPGVLGDINGIVSKAKGNIRTQYLSTDQNIGFLVMDIENVVPAELKQQVSGLSTSIKTRVIGE
jgi:D-3-phosphoglycerate dehydrogenase / 2-oxoglutarate reductase